MAMFFFMNFPCWLLNGVTTDPKHQWSEPLGRAGTDAFRPQVDLARPAGRLGVLFALIHAENPDAIVSRLDGVTRDEWQNDVCRRRVAVWIAVTPQLGGFAFLDQLFQPANATNARFPLREN